MKINHATVHIMWTVFFSLDLAKRGV